MNCVSVSRLPLRCQLLGTLGCQLLLVDYQVGGGRGRREGEGALLHIMFVFLFCMSSPSHLTLTTRIHTAPHSPSSHPHCSPLSILTPSLLSLTPHL